MTTTRAKRGETADRIYKLLHRNPDLTTNEIASLLPGVSSTVVQLTVSRMRQRGEIERRGRKVEQTPSGKLVPYHTYHVKYNSRPKPKPKKKRAKVPRVVEAPKPQPTVSGALQKLIDDWIEEPVAPPVEAPKVVRPAPQMPPQVERAKPEPGGPTTPVAEREVLALRHLSDIYKTLNFMADQQEALIEVFKDTLTDLAKTKEELDRERQRRNWWDRLKDLF